MNIIIRNIRCLANTVSRNKLANLCRVYHPLLVAIAETMVDYEKIPSSCWRALHSSLVAVSKNICANLWILCKESMAMDIVFYSD